MSDIEKIKKLREATGAGFKDCNLAIKESGGDLDKAVEILRIKGISKASKKMSRDAKEGVIAVSDNEKQISLIEVNCETDFVAKNDDFINFVKEICELNNNVNSDLESLKKSKMVNGKTVDENLVALIAKIGEKITIGKTKTVINEGAINSKYLHTVVKDNLAKLAVAVSLETKDNSENVKNFELEPLEEKSYSKVFNDSFWIIGQGTILLINTDKQYNFGAQISMKNGRKIINILNARIKKYKSAD